MRVAIAILVAMFAVACAHKAEPVIRTVEVVKPVAVACNPNVGPEPSWVEIDRLLLSGSPDEMLKAAYAGYKLARGYIAEQAAGLKGCAG